MSTMALGLLSSPAMSERPSPTLIRQRLWAQTKGIKDSSVTGPQGGFDPLTAFQPIQGVDIHSTRLAGNMHPAGPKGSLKAGQLLSNLSTIGKMMGCLVINHLCYEDETRRLLSMNQAGFGMHAAQKTGCFSSPKQLAKPSNAAK